MMPMFWLHHALLALGNVEQGLMEPKHRPHTSLNNHSFNHRFLTHQTYIQSHCMRCNSTSFKGCPRQHTFSIIVFLVHSLTLLLMQIQHQIASNKPLTLCSKHRPDITEIWADYFQMLDIQTIYRSPNTCIANSALRSTILLNIEAGVLIGYTLNPKHILVKL